MERDIRDLFRENDDFKKDLPKSHREDFLKKINKNITQKPKWKFGIPYKIALAVTVIFSLMYFFNPKTDDVNNINSFENQFSKIENDYLKNIDIEWKQFKEKTTDTLLIRKYEEKLNDFNNDYKKITNQLKEFPNNINLLESLINNLQRRLQLIKEINEHIKELNQKNTSNETIYI
ncbi:hypothetical protein BW723_05440 [Polaribacter reichenbachii]|uniref:Anti-sigma factor n=1 Tax=Polaribacter reichenbachii TaxID=996801 RepID=A0A1B8TU29_9FLAO|nr:hypothetical protein [Polaribacter reichenbachii]APZ45773.1 hypothetical protein BW723_05440 [Polaribacter reichenbachii]AUC19635.1 hypothetical protein BTO17_13455 [Polaribacter reichenbachii]OBY63211.1 hypothetical protein LPB301_10270 [Polaribacter reichenbachii]